MDDQTEFRPIKPGRYKRQFDWRLSDGTEATRDRDIKAISKFARAELVDLLEDFLDISRKRRHNWTALAKLQLWSLQELLDEEAAAKAWRDRIEELERAAQSGPMGVSYSAEMDIAKREQFIYRLYANALRVIGDGIAWRALGYDRAVIRLMSERQTKQHLSSEGTVQELREWSHQFESGNGLPIFNALTNCFAIGDVTVIKADGAAEIIEVKSSKVHSPRIVRQKHAMHEVVTMLDEGSGQTQGRNVQIEILPITPETGLSTVRDLIEESTRMGFAADKISNCLYVEAYDYFRVDDVNGLNRDADEKRERALADWKARGDRIVKRNTLDALSFSPNWAPFSVFPFKTRTCVELAIGARMYRTFLNVNAVAREFEHRGWAVEKTTEQLAKEGNMEALLIVSKNGLIAQVPPSDFGRMQIETLRPQTIIQALDTKVAKGPPRGLLQQSLAGEYTLGLYSGESELWD